MHVARKHSKAKVELVATFSVQFAFPHSIFSHWHDKGFQAGQCTGAG